MILYDIILAAFKVKQMQNDNFAKMSKSQANIVISECMRHAGPGVFDAFKREDISAVLVALQELSNSISAADSFAILDKAGLRKKMAVD